MSGGGGYFEGLKVGDVRRYLEQSSSQTEQAIESAQINDYIRDLLGSINNRDVESINSHLNEILNSISEIIDGQIDLKYGGSVSKRTYVDGLSDVDCLVILKDADSSKNSPSEVKHLLAQAIEARFPRTEVTEGRLAISVKFSDIEIQILPAIKKNGSVCISSSDGIEWAGINPKAFADKLSKVNSLTSGKAIPTIKLVKTLVNASFPESIQVSGYHAEAIAVEVFERYEGPYTHRALLKHYFEKGAEVVKSPIIDSTGQSVHVDEYLGGFNSPNRLALSDWFLKTARKISAADNKSSLHSWKKIFGDD